MIKKYINIFKITILVILIGISFYYFNAYRTTLDDLKLATSNAKAYASELDSVKTENRVFKFSVEQLQYYNDSILTKMEDVRKELKIKDNKIASMQYMLSEASRKDTIILKDTIFKDPSFALDTIIGDQWYNLELGLKYPSQIVINPTFISEKYIMTYTKKETIDPPKKFFLCRWFQKKQTVLEVKIVEKNPYIEQKESKFIEIIK